jgi:hypothetical protein
MQRSAIDGPRSLPAKKASFVAHADALKLLAPRMQDTEEADLWHLGFFGHSIPGGSSQPLPLPA